MMRTPGHPSAFASITIVICFGLGISDAAAFLAGDSKGKTERDCYIGLNGYDASDQTPFGKKGKPAIQCTDCDPSCDLDGVSEANGSCTFLVGACVNQPDVEGCSAIALKKVKATARAKKSKVDLNSPALPLDGSSVCGALLPWVVPVKGKKQNKPGKGKVTLVTKGPTDKDKFTFVCNPRPEGEACPCVATSGTFCDVGNGTIRDSATDLQWEKKDGSDGMPDPGNLHDVDNQYAWAGVCSISNNLCQLNPTAAATCTAQTGGAVGCEECAAGEGNCALSDSPWIATIWDWVNQLNAAGFAGYSDWRVPTSAGCCGYPTGKPAEFESIIDLSSYPTIDPIFGPTIVNVGYHSASEHPHFVGQDFGFDFSEGSLYLKFKDDGGPVRAVR